MTMQPTYAIGDIQGCLQSLLELIERIPADARLLFVGDLINRGPQSLETLRYIRSLGNRAKFLLGNHDLHALCIAAGHGNLHRKDTLQNLFQAPDCDRLIDWLRHGHIMLEADGVCCVHAGLHPTWTLATARELAHRIETQLHSNQWKEMFRDMYGPEQWTPTLHGTPRNQAILNAFTRIRYVHNTSGLLDFHRKDSPTPQDDDLIPWFLYSNRVNKNIPICFGHWSTLGLINQENIMSIDTGCLWGGELTAINLQNRTVISVPAPRWADPLAF